MSEVEDHTRTSIPEDVMLTRLAQSEQMREFFIQMWLQNPWLAKHSGSKLQNILSPVCHPGLRLPEIPLRGPASADISGA